MDTTIDRYKILKSLNKGGMGEVFLAYDPLCKREIALKQILPELKHHLIIKERFLREAQIASQLSHPAIIPIFSIDPHEDKSYYTMPYVEGETLKQILKTCLEEEKQGEIKHPLGASIPALTRIFLALCEAIAYAHSKGVVHRDLKPDNILVGRYGQVLLLDWGLADRIGHTESAGGEVDEADYKDLTRPGKVPGTLNYIAPERLRQEPSHVSVDIYSLGVILYQLLTLKSPFHRTSVKEYKKKMHLETLIDPIERAPSREIPQHLSDIAKRCLQFDPQARFASVDEIVLEIKNFLEGKPEWSAHARLDPTHPDDWEFQEHILLSPYTALASSAMQWAHLMISQAPFPGNLRLRTRFKHGIGLLVGIPEKEQRRSLTEGLCLYLSSESRLLYNQMTLLSLPQAAIQDDQWHEICVDKIDNQLWITLDSHPVGHYISQIPLSGTHIGILCDETQGAAEPLHISISSQPVQVSCLAIPDAFLNHKDYLKARQEYQTIASSFSGRAEGQEALFRIGLTLLEEGKAKKSEALWMCALEQFGTLRHTPAAPLEYLGKSLVYQACHETEEELKCLELALRKYKGHPLIKRIEAQILLRLYETAASDKVAAYGFALLGLRHLPHILSAPAHSPLLDSLSAHQQPLPFFLPGGSREEALACALSVWLGKPIPLVEILETSASAIVVSNALYALMMLGHAPWAEENLDYLKEDQEYVKCALSYFTQGPQKALENLSHLPPSAHTTRCAAFLLDRALLDHRTEGLLPYFKQFAPGLYPDPAVTPPRAVPENALFWEKVTLWRQWEWYAHCTHQTELEQHYAQHLKVLTP